MDRVIIGTDHKGAVRRVPHTGNNCMADASTSWRHADTRNRSDLATDGSTTIDAHNHEPNICTHATPIHVSTNFRVANFSTDFTDCVSDIVPDK